MASQDPDKEPSSQNTCHICQEPFNNPVTLSCGHLICNSCLTKHLGEAKSETACPQCGEASQGASCEAKDQPATPPPSAGPVREEDGADAENGESGKSKEGGKKLYCMDDQLPICLPCDTSKDHGGHDVVSKEGITQDPQAAPSEDKASGVPVLEVPPTEEEKEAMCPICWEYLIDPVTLDCGHNFCHSCITEHYEKGAQLGKVMCPLCKFYILEGNFRPNPQLAKVVEDFKFRELKSYKEKIQAQLKSCEEKKRQLVDQKLEEEAKSKECMEMVYLEMQKSRSAFDRMHTFLEEREIFWISQMRNLRRKIEQEAEKNDSKLSIDISHFTNLVYEMKEKCEQPPHEFMRDIEDTIFRFEKQQEKESEGLSTWFEESQEMCRQKNSALISTMEKCAESMEDTLKKTSVEKDVKTGFLMQLKNKVSVTLDAETAYPELIVSADLKSVKTGDMQWELPENPKRFVAEPCVLGCEKFTSGRHWWEVEVDVDLSDTLEGRDWSDIYWSDLDHEWIIGVARKSVRRKREFNPSPKTGIWAVGGSPSLKEVMAFTPRKLTRVKLRQELKKIRVVLDYDAGQVEFLDGCSNTSLFIFSSATFAGDPVCPFFSLQGKGLEIRCLN